MKTYDIITKYKDEQGVTVIIVAIALVMIIGFAALAVDIGYVAVTKNELQNVADASALAAAGELGAIYQALTYDEQQDYEADTSDVTAIRDTVTNTSTGVAKKNKAATKFVEVLPEEIQIGRWKSEETGFDPNGFTPTLNQPDAVKVTTRRDDSVSTGKVGMFFARVFGFDSVPVKAQATAALTSLSNVGPGGLPIPVGISKYWFDYDWGDETEDFCNQPIQFSPTGVIEGCAGWHIYDTRPNDWQGGINDVLDQLLNGPYESPETQAGDEYYFKGGVKASAFPYLDALFQTRRLEEPPYDEWSTAVVVYDRPDCSNPNPNEATITILGFATAIITAVEGSPSHTIQAQVICESVQWGRGGGGDYGTMGTIPGWLYNNMLIF